jgi:predicted ATPase/DNA-binding winged helix-turn-helix (wHTH) protein
MIDIYRFREFEVHVAERRVLRAGEPLHVGARALDVLLALLERGGELITKDQLLERAWPGLVVEEANVHVQVSQLRKLLGAGAIATVAGIGYRFSLPLAARDATPALPAERTPFVGREAALVEAADALADTRLLTLVGIGGTGKTRLALRLAMQKRGEFADGVAWVDLAPLIDPAHLAHAVMQGMGCRLEAGVAPLATLIDFARERRLLLVLDNCEHLLDAVAALTDQLLAASAGLLVLATSRDALGLPGERTLPVRPMELPAPGDDAAHIVQSEAVLLFMQRAVAAAPSLQLREAAPLVARICRRVDGIPLALELAAAQLRVMAPAQLLQMLDQHFQSWAAGPRHALARQQTLHAVIQWSYEHLDKAEQHLLGVLAVCRSGCDMEAVLSLLGQHARRAQLLSGLSRLADLSLLAVKPGVETVRYELLETVRHFGLEQLHASGAAAEVRERHVLYFLALAEAHDADEMGDGKGAISLARLVPEHDNLMQAIAWCERDDELDTVALALRLVAALRHYWWARGQLRLGLELTQSAVQRANALAAAGRPVARQAQMWAMASLVQLHRFLGETELAVPWGERLVEVTAALKDAEARAMGHRLLGSTLGDLGRWQEAQEHLDESLRIARSAVAPRRIADALHGLAILAMEQQRFGEALERMDEVLVLSRQQGHGFRLAASLKDTAVLAILCGNLERARALAREAIQLLPMIGSRLFEVSLIDQVATIMAAGGDLHEAVPLYAATLTQRHAAGMIERASDRERRAFYLQSARATLGDEAFEASWSAGTTLSLDNCRERTEHWLGSLIP